ncbi:MAG TPA: hypothetical protein VLT89_10715, partial [Usitatibacter sp.]|nr:hypothetical protein [Usitatibacter sp.]
LGGLIQQTTSRGGTGIPLISKIPVLGALFGTQTYSNNRTELVLLITPRIVSDTTQAREVTKELREKLPSLRDVIPPPPQTPAPPQTEMPAK